MTVWIVLVCKCQSQWYIYIKSLVMRNFLKHRQMFVTLALSTCLENFERCLGWYLICSVKVFMQSYHVQTTFWLTFCYCDECDDTWPEVLQGDCFESSGVFYSSKSDSSVARNCDPVWLKWSWCPSHHISCLLSPINLGNFLSSWRRPLKYLLFSSPVLSVSVLGSTTPRLLYSLRKSHV